MSGYDEYMWEILRSYELYYHWNYEDFNILVERESKAVRYVLHFIWDCLNKYESSKVKELLEIAKKYYIWILPEIRNKELAEIVAERISKLEK